MEVEQAMTKTLVVLAFSAVLPAFAQEQAPKPVSESSEVHFTGTIEAISPSTREVTVNVNGKYHTFAVKPDVKRFDELKVGDKLSGSYHEAILVEVRKPGAPAPAPVSDEPTRVAGQGVKPSGAIVRQERGTVEVKAIDRKVPSITVLTDDKRTVSFKVEKPERLQGLKVGDKIDITYTEALIVNVE
jgi:Cu/Ag efflux protein CusF